MSFFFSFFFINFFFRYEEIKTFKCKKESLKAPRRYKTPSPQLLRVRREAANARERRRMNHLNVAFEQVNFFLD